MKTLLAIVSIVLLCTGIFAQTGVKPGLTDDEINQLASNLSMKLILSESQEKEVISLLKNYRTDLTKVTSSSVAQEENTIMSVTNEKIVELLDSKQKMKFNVISADWWASVQKAQSN